MRTIMAFGDSLTWGTDPVGGGRHAFADRWTSALAAGLGPQYAVIPEGLGGRTTVFDDHAAAFDRNGSKALPMLLATHSPLDLVIIMLGANDLKASISPSAHGALAGMGRLVEIVRSFPYRPQMPVPKVFVISPPHFRDCDNGEGPASGRIVAESHKLAAGYRQIAEANGCGFFDAATVATAHGSDGVHLDAQNTRAIGAALVEPVRAFLG
ncbi:SGNH/GDSL hydrolase family protein [Neoaquamicrobium microcysteis]|nr:SGNH/GDSL hydrolase family protein [Mesorhizobium microcysteis]